MDLHKQNEKTYALTDCVFDPILQTNLYFSMISGTEVQFLPVFMMWTPRNMTLSSSISSHCPHQSLRNRSDGVPIKTCPSVYLVTQGKCLVVFLFFLAFDFCRFSVVIRFFHPSHNGQWPPSSKDFRSQILSITFIFLIILILEKEPVFSLFNVEC